MEDYNNMIESIFLNWIEGLGKINMPFWWRMKKDIEEENIKNANQLGIDDDVRDKVNHRIITDELWRKKIISKYLSYVFFSNLGFDNDNKINTQAEFQMSLIIYGFYKDAKDAISNIKI